MTTLIACVAALTMAGSGDVTGTWNMGLQGDHVIPTALVLQQDGKAVTGTIALPTQRTGQRTEVKLTGEMVDGALKLSGSVDSADGQLPIDISGSLKDDGSLEGTIVVHGHNLSWTAERLRERKPQPR